MEEDSERAARSHELLTTLSGTQFAIQAPPHEWVSGPPLLAVALAGTPAGFAVLTRVNHRAGRARSSPGRERMRPTAVPGCASGRIRPGAVLAASTSRATPALLM